MKVNVKNSNKEIHIENDLISERQHVMNILRLLIGEKINIKNLSIKRNKLNNIIAEYASNNSILNKKGVIDKVVKVLAKRKR